MTGTEEWDERYAASERIWSGHPNGALVAEVTGLPPGRGLDVGCGEGADAVWLAARGWDVTALDVSGVALDRARAHAAEAGVTITWLHRGLLDGDGLTGFDLVSAQYPALRRTPGADAERALLAAVAPGGTLLVVHHDVGGHAREAGLDPAFDPDEYVLPRDVAKHLDGGWRVEADEFRDRVVAGGAGAHHHRDVVLRATRTG